MSDIQKAIGQNSNKWTAYDVQFTNKSFIGNGNRRKSRKKKYLRTCRWHPIWICPLPQPAMSMMLHRNGHKNL